MSGIAQQVAASQADLTALTATVAGLSGAANSKSRLMYVSSGTATVGNNSSARASMLPPAATGSSLLIKANALPIGGCLMLNGAGLISAATATPGSFTFLPNITPAGGSKTDLGGLSVTPLIGVAGICQLWMLVCQTSGGLLTSGIVTYGNANGQGYSLLINPTATVVASDPSVDRTFGVDGQWQTANTANYITAQLVQIALYPVST